MQTYPIAHSVRIEPLAILAEQPRIGEDGKVKRVSRDHPINRSITHPKWISGCTRYQALREPMKKRKKSLKSVKKKAWSTFSKYIRTKYSKDGMCGCFTCGRQKPIKEIQCGHGVSGRSNGVLFLEEVCRPQCYGCNVGQGGMYEVFIPKLIELYGMDGYQEFVRMKNTPVKFTIPELEDMMEEWNDYLENHDG